MSAPRKPKPKPEILPYDINYCIDLLELRAKYLEKSSDRKFKEHAKTCREIRERFLLYMGNAFRLEPNEPPF